MSSYLPENNSYNVNDILISPLQQIEYEHVLSKQVEHTQDTIAAAEKKEKARQVRVGSRPALPAAGKSKNPNYLSIVGEAFAKAFTSMSQGTITQILAFAELQKLDTTTSHSILQSTKNTIDKEKKEVKLAAEVSRQEKKSAKEDNIVSDVTMALGMVLILVTIVSAIFDAGASLLAVPEEGALLAAGDAAEAGAEGAEVASDMIEMDTFHTDPSDPDGSDSTNEESSTNSPTEETTETESDEQTDKIEKETTKDLDRTSNENDKSEENFNSKAAKWLGKKAVQFFAAVGFGMPTLLKGIQGIKTGDMYYKTARAQKQVGDAFATLQRNEIGFRFYQQLVQRTSGVAREETNGSSQVVETFADITKAYQQISYGLANTV